MLCCYNGKYVQFYVFPEHPDYTAANCSHLKQLVGVTDGEYTIYPPSFSGHSVTIYCHDMGGDPREYITLQNHNMALHATVQDTDSCRDKPEQYVREPAMSVFRKIRIYIDVRTLYDMFVQL